MKKRISRKTILLSLALLIMFVYFSIYRAYYGQNFQLDSETLVTGVIRAQQEGEYNSKYGLGRYSNILGTMTSYKDKQLVSNEEVIEGYVANSNKICLDSNYFTYALSDAKFIQFNNEELYKILDYYIEGGNVILTIDCNQLSNEKNGSIVDAIFYDQDMKEINSFYVAEYISSYGLQGKIFSGIAKIMNYKSWKNISLLITTFMTSLVFVTISYLVCLKMNVLMGVCYYLIFLLSPWTNNFASNLYWVEFTWFIPMLVGLLFSIRNNDDRNWIFYLFSFISILVKSLCGYEYISTIMMGIIMFPMLDLFVSIYNKDKKLIIKNIKYVILLGLSALSGFFVAIIIHANLRGSGDILVGIKSIWENDVLRRTLGGDVELFPEDYRASLEAGIGEVLAKYFSFSTAIISSVPGFLFIPICILSMIIGVLGIFNKKESMKELFIYVFAFVSTISWFILAKAHSYIHTHMNYVLWYFGYVQLSFYFIIKRSIVLLRDRANLVDEIKSLERKIIKEIEDL